MQPHCRLCSPVTLTFQLRFTPPSSTLPQPQPCGLGLKVSPLTGRGQFTIELAASCSTTRISNHALRRQRQTRVWNRWIAYLGTVSRLRPLPRVSRLFRAPQAPEAHIIVSGFAQALRTGPAPTHGRKGGCRHGQSDIGSLFKRDLIAGEDPQRPQRPTIRPHILAAPASRARPSAKREAIQPARPQDVNSTASPGLQRHTTADLAIRPSSLPVDHANTYESKAPPPYTAARRHHISPQPYYPTPIFTQCGTVASSSKDQERSQIAPTTTWATSDPKANR
jgi:hypothetical protein